MAAEEEPCLSPKKGRDEIGDSDLAEDLDVPKAATLAIGRALVLEVSPCLCLSPRKEETPAFPCVVDLQIGSINPDHYLYTTTPPTPITHPPSRSYSCNCYISSQVHISPITLLVILVY